MTKFNQYSSVKKYIVVLFASLVIAIGASGCLQVGKVDEGVALYEKVAEYLPENAMHNPEVYELRGVDDNSVAYLTYMWQEEPYEVSKEDLYKRTTVGSSEIGSDGTLQYYHYKRALHVLVDKNSNQIIGMVYDRDERDMTPPTKEPELTRSKEVRDAYVKAFAEDVLGLENIVYKEGYVEKDNNGNAVNGYYYHGTIADEKQYTIHLNYQYGYVIEAYYFPYDALDGTTVERTFMLEGMEEKVILNVNRQPNYYALYTDPTMFSSQISGIGEDGSFCDVYLRDPDDDTLIETYMKVGFVPHITIGEWLDEVETDSDFAKFAPQVNPLSSYPSVAEWEPTGEYKVFASEPNCQWREYMSSPGVVNRCYLTSYRDGVMSIQISHPYGSAYMEGIGSRINQMLDTLVLATE